MNIIYVSDQYWPSVSGVPVSMDSFRDNLSKKGHQFFLLVPDYPGASDWDKENNAQNVFRFRSHSLFFSKENRLVYKSEKKKIFARLDMIKPDIIHIHTEFSLAKMVMRYAKKKNIPMVLTAHTNWEELINEYIKFIPPKMARLYCRSLLRRMFNKVDVVIAPTSLMEDRLRTYSVRSPIRIIPTGVDMTYFPKNNNPQMKDHKTLLYVGRLSREKNVKFLIDVFLKLIQTNSTIELVIVGDGPDKIHLENYSKQRGVDSRITFTGYVPRHQLVDFYSMAHVFVFASKVESQGLVIVEAMICGTPVVAIGEMGTREVMESGAGGYMVDDDLDLFTEKVDLLLNNLEIHKTKSDEALLVAKSWGNDVMSSRVLTLYEELLNERRA